MEKNKTITQLKKIFRETKPETEIIPEAERRGMMDPANVCMIIPKTYEMQECMAGYEGFNESKAPELNYTPNEKALTTENKSKYSIEYLSFLLELLKITKDETQYAATISVLNDYPLKVETHHFIFILANRISNE